MYEWSNQMGSRRRQAWLLLIDPAGTIHRFAGATIPGVAAVVGEDYKIDGKWSHTTYRLELASGVRAIAGYDGWETGRFIEGLATATHRSHCDRWIDVANAVGVTLAEAQRFLREWRPQAAEALDKVEADLQAVDTQSEDGAEVVTISFGGPTRSEMAAGFWERPVVVRDAAGNEVGRVEPDSQCGWDRCVATGPVRVLAVEHVAGYHGGTVSLRLAVPAGCMACHD